ncbi:unnamed protein product [Blepharisma stoltei]|uniref:Peptidase C1A papain C-terminal domain-containing protein n=1 Tax=Blepharisma stoltei TaxID=1481888 RepID=A0AAU9IGD6_9CILI|nr:unnamed protein product [Blepharisma stoltei]
MRYYKAASFYTLSKPASIQAEVLQNGPIEVSFQVYQDFYAYKSGVYKHTTGKLVSRHSAKIIGWGAQGETNYWIVANSWGDTWGMNGYFWIAFGDYGINNTGVAGLPAV